jgi:hypothetical protein
MAQQKVTDLLHEKNHVTPPMDRRPESNTEFTVWGFTPLLAPHVGVQLRLRLKRWSRIRGVPIIQDSHSEDLSGYLEWPVEQFITYLRNYKRKGDSLPLSVIRAWEIAAHSVTPRSLGRRQ